MAKKRKNRIAEEPRNDSNFYYPAPLYPRNELQQHYIQCIRESPIVVATGYPGTGKTYIPARIAAEQLKKRQIDHILLMRPNVSASRSLGYFKGDKNEKMMQWLAPVLGALKEEFTPAYLTRMTDERNGTILLCPLELIKGLSLHNTFVIADEAEDLTIREIKSIVTRIGENSTVVLCGDTQQTDIHDSGLTRLCRMIQEDKRLSNLIGTVDFNDPQAIVRSVTCREMILGFERAGI